MPASSSARRCRGVRRAGHAESRWALLQRIQQVTDKKVRYIIASTIMPITSTACRLRDHTDAVIIAQERAGEYKDNDETADEKQPALDQRAARCFHGSTPTPRVPRNITFRDRMTIALASKRLSCSMPDRHIPPAT